MTAAQSIDHGAWSPARWFCVIAGIFATQVGLIWLLAERVTPPPARLPFPVAMRLEASSTPSMGESQPGANPALFALPTDESFSGYAWLRYQLPAYEMTAWNERPHWLTLDQRADDLTDAFAQVITTNSLPPLRVADLALPESSVAGEPTPELPVTRQTYIEVQFSQGQWSPVNIPTLPSWRHSDVLSNTVIRVLLDRAGVPLSCMPIGSCGAKDADQFALGVAVDLRFRRNAPTPRAHATNELTSGKVIFHWHTVPP